MSDPIKILVTKSEIAENVAKGYPLTCATCIHFYTAKANGSDSCGKTACGGPIVGRDYPDYKGQIPRSKFASICLMCGTGKIAYHVVVPGNDQRFGLCEEHKDTFTGIVANPAYCVTQTPPLLIPLIG